MIKLGPPKSWHTTSDAKPDIMLTADWTQVIHAVRHTLACAAQKTNYLFRPPGRPWLTKKKNVYSKFSDDITNQFFSRFFFG